MIATHKRYFASFATATTLTALSLGACDRQKAQHTDTNEKTVTMSVSDITPQQARERLETKDGTVYLDVRTVGEFQEGRPAGAWNIPVMLRDPETGQMQPNDAFSRVVQATFAKDTPIIAGCRSGGRSARAAALLMQAGYTNVVNMSGGFGGAHDAGGALVQPGWSALDLPVESGDAGARDYDALQKQ